MSTNIRSTIARPVPRRTVPSSDGAVYARRRLMALLAMLVTVTVVALLVVVGYGMAGAESAGAARLGATSSSFGAGVQVHVVRPGDTLWSIARVAQPVGDVRPLVGRLLRQTGSHLDVGMRVELPG